MYLYKRLLRLHGQFWLQETDFIFPGSSVFQLTHLNSHNMIANMDILVPTRNLQMAFWGVWHQSNKAHFDTHQRRGAGILDGMKCHSYRKHTVVLGQLGLSPARPMHQQVASELGPLPSPCVSFLKLRAQIKTFPMKDAWLSVQECKMCHDWHTSPTWLPCCATLGCVSPVPMYDDVSSDAKLFAWSIII